MHVSHKNDLNTGRQLKILKRALNKRDYLLIFDMDGTITEKTEPKCINLILRSIKHLYGEKVFRKARGIINKHRNKLLGKPDFEMIKDLATYLGKYGIKINYKRVSLIYRKMLGKNLDKIYNERSFMPYFKQFIKNVKNDFCIVSSALKMQIKAISMALLKITNKKPRFFISYEKTKRHKPSPDPYLKAKETLKKLGYKNGVVFEDSENGIRAAKKAGFEVIKISRKNKYDHLTWREINNIL